MDFSNLRVAITGASSGIGAAVARTLAQKGASVGIAARRKERLMELAAELKTLGAKAVVWRECDVGRWDDLAAFADACRAGLGDVDVVVANAGFGNFTNTLDMEPADIERLFRTNVTGAVWTVRAFGEQLSGRRGHAIVVGSIVSKVAVPYGSVYSASKWALRGWTRGARPELEARNIALTLFNPGYVRTEFFRHRVRSPGTEPWNPDRGMSAEQVAKRMLRAIRRRPAEMEMTLLSRVAIPVYRLMPIWWPRIMARVVRSRAEALVGTKGKSGKSGP